MTRNEELAAIDKFIAERGVSRWEFATPDVILTKPQSWREQATARYKAAAAKGGKKSRRGRPRKS